ISCFLKRNPCVASIIGRKIEAARAKGLYKRLCLELGIQAKGTWNIDETRKALGVYANTRVLLSS
ncbi:hypothetical protein BU23DRAFT_489630, partial [Bimuria novae-zelandiae CBS 107.79]